MPLARFNADVVALTEWQGAREHIDSFAHRKGHDVAGGQSDAFALTRGRVIDRQLHHMTEHWWWGPSRRKLRRREPRVYIELLIEFADGTRLLVLAVHSPPGGWMGALFRTGGKNKPANRETARFIKDWIERHPDGVVAGDLNLTKREVRKHITTRYANTGKVDGAAWGRDLEHVSTETVSRVPGHGAGVITLQEAS